VCSCSVRIDKTVYMQLPIICCPLNFEFKKQIKDFNAQLSAIVFVCIVVIALAAETKEGSLIRN
jgi:hypothetical protein